MARARGSVGDAVGGGRGAAGHGAGRGAAGRSGPGIVSGARMSPPAGRFGRWAANAALVGFSVLTGVLAGELYLTLRPPPDRAEQMMRVARRAAERWGAPFDPRTRNEVIQDLRDAGVDAYPPYSPCGAVHTCRSAHDVAIPEGLLPLGGLSARTIVDCNEMGSYLVYRTDEHGFNNPPNLWSSAVDVAAVGDSFTHGLCVPPERSLLGRVRNVWPRTLNLGMSGNGPLLMLATLREYLPRVKPRVVLWVYFEGNDLQNLRDEIRSPLLASYLEGGDTGRIVSRQATVDSVLLAWLTEVQRNERVSSATSDSGVSLAARLKGVGALHRTRGLVSDALQRGSGGEPRREHDVALFGRVLQTARTEVRSWGGEMYLVYLPAWERYHAAMPEADRAREQVLELTRELGIRLIDVEPSFGAQRDPSLLFAQFEYRPAHYSEAGYQLAAEAVIRALSSHPLNMNDGPQR